MELAAREARAIAIAAQGLAAPRVDRSPAGDRTALRAMFDRLGVVQIDSVSVLARSHYLPAFSRLGSYDIAELDRMSHESPREVFEYWGHEASLLPVELQPALRWRMARAGEQAWQYVRAIRRRRVFVTRILCEVRDRGPIRAGEIETAQPRKSGSPGKQSWVGSDVKVAFEWLFWSGQVTSARRRGFERLYDLPERVLPAAIVATPTPAEADAVRALIERAARALGVGTETDLRDYFRIKAAVARQAIAELVELSALQPVRVEGWSKPAYVHRNAVAAEHAIDRGRAALLSPFDSLVWCRERTERLFGMRYRIEIYTPQPERVYGYYVLPFLLGDQLVARVDLKADREARVLRVQAAHGEPGAPRTTASALAGELRRMASWLGLDGIAIEQRGDLAARLSSAVAR